MARRKSRYSGIGGQAVLEGVMMKNKEKYAVAVRKPDGEKRPFRKPDGEKRPYRKPDGEKRPFRKPDGEKRPFHRDGARKPRFTGEKRSFRNKT